MASWRSAVLRQSACHVAQARSAQPRRHLRRFVKHNCVNQTQAVPIFGADWRRLTDCKSLSCHRPHTLQVGVSVLEAAVSRLSSSMTTSVISGCEARASCDGIGPGCELYNSSRCGTGFGGSTASRYGVRIRPGKRVIAENLVQFRDTAALVRNGAALRTGWSFA